MPLIKIITPETRRSHKGFTLIELIIFIVVVGVATAGLFAAINPSVVNSVNPIYQVRALELAQAQLDLIFGKRYDEQSPVGGFPPCSSGEIGAATCSTTLGPDSPDEFFPPPNSSTPDLSLFDDVDDYINATATVPSTYSGFTMSIEVEYAGTDLGLNNTAAKLITVTVTPSAGYPVTLSAYRGNF